MSSLANAVARLPWPFGPGRPVSWPASMSWLGLPPSARDASPEAVLAAYAALPADQALGLLQTHREGLPGAEADVRRVVRGPNILPTQRPPSWILTLLAAIPNPFSVLLIFLAIINASVPDRDWVSLASVVCQLDMGPDSPQGRNHGPARHGLHFRRRALLARVPQQPRRLPPAVVHHKHSQGPSPGTGQRSRVR